jgi:PAS domain S-box-containing protein
MLAERTMSEQEARLRILFDTMAEGVVLIAPDGRITEANAAAERILGIGHSEILGRNVSQDWILFRPDGTQMPPEEMTAVRPIRELRPVKDVVMGVRHPGGSIVWLSVSASPILNAEGVIDGVVGTFSDITERRQAEEASNKSDRDYRLLAENTSDVVAIFDMDLNLTWVSPSVERETGYTVEEMKSIPSHKTMTPESIDRAMAVFEMAKQSFEEGKEFVDHFEMEAEVYRKDDSTFWAENSYRLIRDGEGNPTHILMQSRNITERRRAEQALRTSEQTYRMLFDSIPQKAFLKDKNSVYISCNSEYAEDLNIAADEIAGHTDYDFYPRDLAEEYRAGDRRAMESGSIERFEERYIKDGEERFLETFKAPIRDENGDLIGVLGVFHDITEHRKADEMLKESEERLRNMADLLPQSLFEANEEGHITFANRHALDTFGYTKEDLASGITILDTVSPEDRARAIENMNLRLKGSEIPPNEYKALRKDGSTFPAVVFARPMSESGRATGITGILVDISERKKAEETLRQSEARYRLIAENTSDCIWILGPDLVMTYQSPSTERLFGYTLEEWKAVGWRGWLHPDDYSAVTSILRDFRERVIRKSILTTARVRNKGGRILWLEISATPIHGHDGKLTSVVGVSRDVTERKEYEIRLTEYRTAVEQSSQGIALSDLQGDIRFVNESWAVMHGYSVEELVGKHLSVFHTQEQYQSQVVPFLQHLTAAGSHHGEVGHVRKDGEVFLSYMTTSVLTGPDGKPFGHVALMRDITAQIEAERERQDRILASLRAEHLAESRRRLIQVQEALRKDIASQLHGTVQNRLILLTHRLAELEAKPVSEQSREELSSIRRQLERLQNDYIRPIGHRLFPSILRMGVVAGLESLMDQYSTDLTIQLRISKRLRNREQADRRLIPDDVKLALYRVAEEALGNILKHAPRAANIVVRLSLSNSSALCLEVTDAGRGFDTGEPTSGIGLAIASDYAAAAGGSLVVKSVPGKGTSVRHGCRFQRSEQGGDRDVLLWDKGLGTLLLRQHRVDPVTVGARHYYPDVREPCPYVPGQL